MHCRYIEDVPRNSIQNPRSDHTIAAIPCSKKKISGGWLRKISINKSQLVLCCENHNHGIIPCIVIGSYKLMGNQNEPRMIPTVKEVRAVGILCRSADHHAIVIRIGIGTTTNQGEKN